MMNESYTEYVLWAVPVGDPDWYEAVITTAPTANDPKFAKAREWATANGFDRFRLARMDGVAPNFAATVAI